MLSAWMGGYYSAMKNLATTRFRRSRDVGAHLGLTPTRYQSGEMDSRPDQPLRRRAHPYCCYEAEPFAPRTQPQVVGAARLGHEDRQGKRHGAGPCRRISE